MASNNRKPPQQPSGSMGGGGRKRNAASQQSSHTMAQQRDAYRHKIENTLKEMFISAFDIDIIQAVAQSSDWKLNKSIATLIMLSEDGNAQKTVKRQMKSKPTPGNPVGSSRKKTFIPATSKLHIPELPNKRPPWTKKEHSKVPEHNPFRKNSTFSNKQQNTMHGSYHPPKKTMEDERSRPIKVAYKGIDPLDSSDDDADVVIEEENEFQFVGNVSPVGIGTFPFPGTSCPSVCQFLSPVMPVIPQKVNNNVLNVPQMATKKQNIVASPVGGKKTTVKTEGKEGTLASVKMVQNKVKPMTALERIRKRILDCTKVMVLMRGCPGSGKSFLAKYLVKSTIGGDYNKYIFTTDNYFVQIGCGQYVFLPARLPEAHEWNRNLVLAEARRGTNPIIVDNTNLEAWEMQPYAVIAVKHGYSVELLEPSTSWRYNSTELARKTIHGVPRKKIQDMLDRFQHDLTGGKLLALLKLKYAPSNKPPQPSAKPLLASQVIQAEKDHDAVSIKVANRKISKKNKARDGNELNMQSVHGVGSTNTPIRDTRPAELTDALAVFFAKKAHEKGQLLESDMFKSKLNSGHTIHNVLASMCTPQTTPANQHMSKENLNSSMCTPQTTPAYQHMSKEHPNSSMCTPQTTPANQLMSKENPNSSMCTPQTITANQRLSKENPNSPSSEFVDLMQHLSAGSKETAPNKDSKFGLFGIHQEDYSSSADSTSDSNDDITDGSDDISIGDEESRIVGEWHKGEDEWEYQSDEDEPESDEETYSSCEEESKLLQGKEDGNLQELFGSNNRCMEYALVLEDNTLLFQKSHEDVSPTAGSTEVLKCNPAVSQDQCWEYVLLTEDSRHLPQKENVESDTKSVISSENASQNADEMTANTHGVPLYVTELDRSDALAENTDMTKHVLESHDLLTDEMVEPLLDLTDPHKSISATANSTDEVVLETLESLINIVAKTDISEKVTVEEVKLHKDPIVMGNIIEPDLVEAELHRPLLTGNTNDMDIVKSDKTAAFMEKTNEMEMNQNLITVFDNREGILVDVRDTSEKCVAVIENTYRTELCMVEPHENHATMLGNVDETSFDLKEFLKSTGAATSDDTTCKPELYIKHPTDGFDSVENNHDILQNEHYIGTQETCTSNELLGTLTNVSSPIPVTNRLISNDEMDQWLRSLDMFACSKETEKDDIPVDLIQNNSNVNSVIHHTNIENTESLLERNVEKITDKSLLCIEAQEMRIQDATSTEEDFESAVSSSASEVDVHDIIENNEGEPKFNIEFKNVKQVPKVDFMSWFQNSNTEITNTRELSADCNSTTDILQEWEQGNVWDEDEVQTPKSDHESVEDPLMPRPARRQRHQGAVKSLDGPSSDVEQKMSNMEFVPPEVKSWLTVAEPVVSWEEKTDDSPVHGLKRSTTPQPQRLMFAMDITKREEFSDSCLSRDKGTYAIDNVHPVLPDNTVEVNNIASSWNNEAKSDNKLEQTFHSRNEDSITEPDLHNTVTFSEIENVTPLDITANSSTNTHYSDFELLTFANAGLLLEVPPEIAVKVARSRNIVEDCIGRLDSEPPKRTRVLLLDKSSMTSQEDEMDMDVRRQFEELTTIFPEISLDNLSEIYKKCNMDLHWTVDVLLESESEGMPLVTSTKLKDSSGTHQMLGEGDSTATAGCIERDSIPSLLDTAEIMLDAEQVFTEPVSLSDPTLSSVSEFKNKSTSPSKRNGKKDRNAPISEINLQLKKQLEENFVINDEHYSSHTLRIRKIRHGEVLDMGDLTSPVGISDVSVCGACDSQVSGTENTSFQIGETMSAIGTVSSQETGTSNCPFWTEESPAILGSVAEGEGAVAAREWVSEGSEIENSDSSVEDEETLPLVLDRNFIDHLHQLFGSTGHPFQQDETPVVNLPLSLARQIHYYLMDAQQSSYELMLQEDEEIARMLQEQEQEQDQEQVAPPKVPNLREIMDMEIALALYKTDQAQWQSETKDDMATKLSKQLLCDTFPTLPHDVLMEVFQAHNNSFEATLEVLLASMGQSDDSVLTVMTPEARAAHERALLEQAKQEGLKYSHVREPPDRSTSIEDEATEDQAFKDAEYYRYEASRHYQLRKDCYQKAQNAYHNGLTSAASYYSQVANLHKQRIDDSNARAASSLLLAHSLGRLTTTLDLHFLYVAEALQVLDMFLDHHIRRLTENVPAPRQVALFLITGRGLRSIGGRSRIKPAVTSRLKQRRLKYVEVNPGLLKIVVTKHVPLSNCFSN